MSLMEKAPITKLQQDLFNQVVSKLKADDAKIGASLNESSLANQFQVSRNSDARRTQLHVWLRHR